MDWKFIMCLLVMCSTTIWKLLEILTYGEIQVRQVDDIMMMYMTFTIYAAYKAGMECGWAVSHGATTAATIQEAVQKFYPFMVEYICDKEDSDNDTQQYILKNLNSFGNSVDIWGRKNDRQHVIDGMSATQKSQLLCYILRNHEAFGKMTCRDWKNWLLDDAEPQFGIWF